MSKRTKVLYWVITLIVLLPTALSGLPELFTNGPQSTVDAYQTLGYPLYLMKILGAAKLAGAVVLLLERSQRLGEWAYAGFTILFLGATASHLFVGDLAHAPIPFAFFLLLLASYALHNKLRTQLSESVAVEQ
ncbi:DoxX family protein [Granulicella arctica]|uniref:DoxX family protein n=1 Tax=Granulicella arctica TaxID=940613 RepID=UPI0021DFCC23|nr:DoxX family protein [Granulicella arctica]